MSTFSIDPRTALGPVSLNVTNLEQSARFYIELLGFKAMQQDGSTLTLSTDGVRPLLILNGGASARRPARTTGLYHFAILTPSRVALARALRQLAENRYPLSGASDHLVSEALYLDDPDGNGIEIYHDRAREEWPRRNGQIMMSTDPFDIDGVIGELDRDPRPWDGLEPDTTIGHVHLHVADLGAAERFYHGVLGFDIIQRYGPGALFVSAGGYHHHIGLNTWAGVGAPQPPADAAGLRSFTIRFASADARAQVLERVQDAGIATEERPEGILVRDSSANSAVLALLP